MQDDLQDMMDESSEVQELLARSYATPDYLDDADLEAGKYYLQFHNMTLYLLLFVFIRIRVTRVRTSLRT